MSRLLYPPKIEKSQYDATFVCSASASSYTGMLGSRTFSGGVAEVWEALNGCVDVSNARFYLAGQHATKCVGCVRWCTSLCKGL